MTIQDAYRASHPKSAALAERARAAIPGGITHDIRHLVPFPVYVERAAGSRKWDVDGHEYVDYWMGHGALFLGHCHPALVKALEGEAARAGVCTIWLGTDDDFGGTNLFGADLYPDVLDKLRGIEPTPEHPSVFYRRLGYTVVGVLPDVDGFGKHDILMAKRIQPQHVT